jgi:hypothetical protein
MVPIMNPMMTFYPLNYYAPEYFMQQVYPPPEMKPQYLEA